MNSDKSDTVSVSGDISQTTKSRRARPNAATSLRLYDAGPITHSFAPSNEREEWQAPIGFEPSELASEARVAIPAWQRDPNDTMAPTQAAALERQSIMRALTKLAKIGVVCDRSGRVIDGNKNWAQHLASLPFLTQLNDRIIATSTISAAEFEAAITLLFSTPTLASVPVALRDLDGWVKEVIHLKKSGPANPECYYFVLPKSGADIAATLQLVTLAFGLSPFEVQLVKGIVEGNTEREMASILDLKLSQIRRGIAQLVAKFKVRQKSDIVRVLASFP